MGLRRRTELILWGLLVALAIVWGTLSALERVGVNWLLYARLQAEANVVETSGISEDDLIAMDIALSDCLKGDSSALETLEVEADGQRQPAFNARERAHMEDCRRLFALLRSALRGLPICMGALAAVLVLLRALPSRFARLTARPLIRAAWLAPLALLIPLGAFALWAAIDFSGAFTFFHHLLFANDLWLLDPRTDLLIRICPSSMFASMGLRIGARALLWMVGTPAAACGIVWLIAKVKESLK